MNPLKTPHQMLMEEAGMAPQSPGLLKTPQQMLIEETNVIPRFAEGKSVKDMQADLFVAKYSQGGQAADPYSHPALVKAFNQFFK